MPRMSGLGWRKEMESPPRLGLRTIKITPFMEGLIYYQSMCLEFRYEDGKVLNTQPYLTCGLASTHCILRLNPIKSTFNIVILDSNTYLHTSINQHGIFILKP